MALIGERYQLGSKLGQGGMGEVYLALDTHTQSTVAVKHLRGAVSHDADVLERFQREGAALRDLNHPNIVKMLDMVQHEDAYYLIMDYIEGGDLAALLKARGQLPVAQAIKMALEIADALSRAHHLGIIHRDIKPANVLIARDGTPRLTDFGVARIDSQERMTGTGVAVGTLDYMPPEAINGEAVDARADIWAFGVMLYEMLAGERPFGGDTTLALLTNILTTATPDLALKRPDAPPALVELLSHMLNKERTTRTRSMRQVGAVLEAILHGDTVNLERNTPSMPRPTLVLAQDTPTQESQSVDDMPLMPTTAVITTPRRRLPIGVISVAIVGIFIIGAGLILTSVSAPVPPTATIEPLPTASATPIPFAASVNEAATEGFQWVSVDEVRLLMPTSYTYIDVAQVFDVMRKSLTTDDLQTSFDAGVALVERQRSVGIYLNWLTLQSAGVLVEDTGVVFTTDMQISRMREFLRTAKLELMGEPQIIELPVGQAVRYLVQFQMNTMESQATLFTFQQVGTSYILIFSGTIDNANDIQPIIETVTNSIYIAEDDVALLPVTTPAPLEPLSMPDGWKPVYGDGFSFALPQEWLTLPANEQLIESTVGVFQAGNEMVEITRALIEQFNVHLLFGLVGEVPIAGAVMTLDTPLDINFDFVEAFLISFTGDQALEITSKDIILPGGAARHLQAYWPQAASDSIIYMLDRPDGIYMLTFVVLSTQYDDLAPTFEQIAQTFVAAP